MKNQFKEINTKLDRLTSAIEKLTLLKETVSALSTKKIAKKVEVKSPVKKVTAKKVVAKKKK